MLEKYKTVYEGGEGEIVEKKSRFIDRGVSGHIRRRSNGDFRADKKAVLGCETSCWAYIIGRNPAAERMSDDGEPAGTAGIRCWMCCLAKESTMQPLW